ncbi:hypothetical protein PV773_17630 [Mesorhizobium sp. CC13]|uniref:hypothetical protein n=1 Tax=Mesorhizobium sp. CC13 TaxID=3029194 RepID=UPI003265999A
MAADRYGRHASQREEGELSAQLMGFLNASLASTETTHIWLQRFSRELVTSWRKIARNSEQEWDVCAEMIANTDPARDLDLSLAHFTGRIEGTPCASATEMARKKHQIAPNWSQVQ